MLTQKHLLAVIGFAFVAAWISFNFGYAVLCLVGAALFYGAGSILEGELDLGELQRRVRSPSAPEPVVPSPPPVPRRAPRVR